MSQAEWDGVTEDMLEHAMAHPITPLYEGDGRSVLPQLRAARPE